MESQSIRMRKKEKKNSNSVCLERDRKGGIKESGSKNAGLLKAGSQKSEIDKNDKKRDYKMKVRQKTRSGIAKIGALKETES